MKPNWKSATLAVGGAALVLGGTMLTPIAAQAGASGRKNTAIALGAAAVYELLKGKTTNGLVLGAGAAYAAKRYEDARKSESNQNRDYYYQNGRRVYYNNNGRSYDNNGYRPDNNQNGDYETYSRNDNNYRDYRSQDNERHYRSQDNRRNNHPGWDRGRKNGWNGHNQPPGQWNKNHNDDHGH